MSQISQIKKIYHAAIYVRLSKEDGAVASHEKTESNSIANQKSLIRDFLENKNDIEVVQEYVDDGFSGSNFERPAFQMMLEDIKKGKIDCVVTKDLSRFGREYIDSGMYIERLFPAMGVRFIAINDGIDSGEAKSQSDEIIIPYDDYTKTNITRDQMAKKTAEVKQKIAEIESLITEKQETLDMQKDLFLDAKQEQLTKLSKLDEFDEEVIRYLIDYVLVYDNEHIEIRWNFDDFQAG